MSRGTKSGPTSTGRQGRADDPNAGPSPLDACYLASWMDRTTLRNTLA